MGHRWIVAMLFLAGGLGACGSSEGATPAGDMAETSSTTADTGVDEPPAVDAGDVRPGFDAPTPADVGLSIPAECPMPWLPVYAQDEKVYPTSVPPSEERPPPGRPIDVVSGRFAAPDTDGDGAPDELVEGVDGDTAFALRRGDGDLILATEGAVVDAPGGASRVGDLDGDGREEVIVFVADSSVSSDYPLYVIPGSTPSGRHDPTAVGARLAAFAGMWVGGVGDVDGDGNDDLLVPGPKNTLAVLSGPAVMDAAGGEVDPDAPPLASLPGDVRSALLLGEDDDHPVFVRVTSAQGDPTTTELVLMTEPPVVLRIDRVPLTTLTALSATITGFENDDGRFVQLAVPMTRSGTQVAFVWGLDDPCAGPTPTG